MPGKQAHGADWEGAWDNPQSPDGLQSVTTAGNLMALTGAKGGRLGTPFGVSGLHPTQQTAGVRLWR